MSSANVVDIGADVLVGAAIRSGLRSDADPAHMAELLEALSRHAAAGDLSCAMLVPWLEERIALRRVAQ